MEARPHDSLSGHVVSKQFALRAIDPYEGIPPTDSHVAVSLLARTFAIPPKALKTGLHKTDGRQQMHGRFRFCTRCMGLAYHGVNLLDNGSPPSKASSCLRTPRE
jgi:hypothetical protein